MDLTALLLAVSIAFGLLTAEAIRNADRVLIEVADLPRMERTSIDVQTVEAEFAAQIDQVSQVASVVLPPEIRTSSNLGLGSAIANTLKIRDLARALESDLGQAPDFVRLALITDRNNLLAVVSGRGRRMGSFREVLALFPDEAILSFIKRCSLVAAANLAPYATTLKLVLDGRRTGDFAPARSMSDRAKSYLPDTPINPDRSLLENLDGIIALMQHDQARARAQFDRAVASDPNNAVANLNAGFMEVQFDEFQEAERRMTGLITSGVPMNNVVRSTAYMTRAAAMLGQKRLEAADEDLAQAVLLFPDNSSAMHMWGETKLALGQDAEGRRLLYEAHQDNDSFENYAEVATLYFRLSWQPGTVLEESPFQNPLRRPRAP